MFRRARRNTNTTIFKLGSVEKSKTQKGLGFDWFEWKDQKIPKGLGVSVMGCLEYLLGLNHIEYVHDTRNFLTLIDFGGRAIKAIMNQTI